MDDYIEELLEMSLTLELASPGDVDSDIAEVEYDVDEYAEPSF